MLTPVLFVVIVECLSYVLLTEMRFALCSTSASVRLESCLAVMHHWNIESATELLFFFLFSNRVCFRCTSLSRAPNLWSRLLYAPCCPSARAVAPTEGRGLSCVKGREGGGKRWLRTQPLIAMLPVEFGAEVQCWREQQLFRLGQVGLFVHGCPPPTTPPTHSLCLSISQLSICLLLSAFRPVQLCHRLTRHIYLRSKIYVYERAGACTLLDI